MVRSVGSGLFAAFAVAASASIIVTAQQVPPAGRGGAAIRLKSAIFTPTRGEQPPIPPGLTVAGYAAGQRGYYLVQFEGPILESWKAEVSGLGVELLDYVPDFAF